MVGAVFIETDDGVAVVEGKGSGDGVVHPGGAPVDVRAGRAEILVGGGGWGEGRTRPGVLVLVLVLDAVAYTRRVAKGANHVILMFKI